MLFSLSVWPKRATPVQSAVDYSYSLYSVFVCMLLFWLGLKTKLEKLVKIANNHDFYEKINNTKNFTFCYNKIMTDSLLNYLAHVFQ